MVLVVVVEALSIKITTTAAAADAGRVLMGWVVKLVRVMIVMDMLLLLITRYSFISST